MDEPLFLRISEVSFWMRERSEMKCGLEVVNPGHMAGDDGLISLLEGFAGAGRPDAAAKSNLPWFSSTMLHVRILQQTAKSLECMEVDDGKLKELRVDVRGEGAIVCALRNWPARHWGGESWSECLAMLL